VARLGELRKTRVARVGLSQADQRDRDRAGLLLRRLPLDQDRALVLAAHEAGPALPAWSEARKLTRRERRKCRAGTAITLATMRSRADSFTRNASMSEFSTRTKSYFA